jgi:hypothetical protein
MLESVQEVLDEAFHNRDDAYPAGTPEHKELVVRIAWPNWQFSYFVEPGVFPVKFATRIIRAT